MDEQDNWEEEGEDWQEGDVPDEDDGIIPYTQSEMERMIHTVVSESLLSDLIETAQNLYHKEVTRAQLECCDMLKEYEMELKGRLDGKEVKNQKNALRLMETAGKMYEAEEIKIGEQKAQLIAAAEEVRDKRHTAIMQFCEEQPSPAK